MNALIQRAVRYDPPTNVWEIEYQRPPESPSDDTRVLLAAVRVGSRVFIGYRHSTIMQAVAAIEKIRVLDQEAQGFVDSNGCFYSRGSAAALAFLRGQIDKIPSTLFSEDLWDNDGNPRPPGPFNPTGDKPK